MAYTRFRGVPLRNVIYRALTAVVRRPLVAIIRNQFASHGRQFSFDPFGCYSFKHIHVGDFVSLGYRPVIMAEIAWVRIGSKVMFGPHVMVIAGNHNTRRVGCFMADIHEKNAEDDLDVVIESDVWVGARAVILNGVRIGRGSIVGAGAIVTKSCPPYSILAGVPARIIRYRWNYREAIEHERLLYGSDSERPSQDLDHLPR